MKKLGLLKKVELREIWANEAGHFTPWLAEEENIALLGDAIGLELEVEGQERNVGPFRADILCKDTNNNWVLIENQLERTDHNHLGQLLTYAAGLEAVTVVWIAQHFTDEHRAALDWLNEKTSQDVNFFGLEIELWQIGESEIAPKFNVVCQPNEWSTTIQPTPEFTKTEQSRLEYWTAFKEYLEASRSFLKCQRPQHFYWYNFSLGRASVYLSARINHRNQEIIVYLIVNCANADRYFQVLKEKYQKQIEESIGKPLQWGSSENVKYQQIASEPFAADPRNQNDWQRQHQWLKNTIEAFHRVFSPIVRQLDPADINEI